MMYPTAFPVPLRAALVALCLPIVLLCTAACTDDRAEARRHLAEGEKALAQRDLARSKSEMHAALALDPELTMARRQLGRVALEMRTPIAAEDYLKQALARGMNGADVELDLLRAQLAQEKFNEVIVGARRHPQDAAFKLLRAEAHWRGGDAGAGAVTFSTILYRDPKQGEAHLGLARIAINRGSAWLAQYHLDKAQALMANCLECRSLRGDLALGQARWPDADAAYNGALAEVPAHPESLLGNARSALMQANDALASRRLKALDAVLRNSNQGAILHAIHALDRGDETEAARQLQGVLVRSPRHVQANYLMALIDMRQGAVALAERRLREVQKFNRGFALAEVRLGELRALLADKGRSPVPLGSDTTARLAEQGSSNPVRTTRERMQVLGIQTVDSSHEQSLPLAQRARLYGNWGFIEAATMMAEQAKVSEPAKSEMSDLLERLQAAVEGIRPAAGSKPR